jgi:hypothetical protein
VHQRSALDGIRRVYGPLVGQIGGALTYASIFVSLPFFIAPSASDDLPLAPRYCLYHHSDQYMSSKEYYCDCNRYCKGVRKKVSPPTYYRHQEYRDPLSQYDQRLQDFLRSKPEVPLASSSNKWKTSRKRVFRDPRVSTDPTNARKKQTQQGADDEIIAVCASSRGQVQ